MPKKTKISNDLVCNTLELLDYLDPGCLNPAAMRLYGRVLYAFGKKKASFARQGGSCDACTGYPHTASICGNPAYEEDEPF